MSDPTLIVKRWNPESDAVDEMQWGGFWAQSGDLEGYGDEPPFFAAKCPNCGRLIWEDGPSLLSVAEALRQHACGEPS